MTVFNSVLAMVIMITTTNAWIYTAFASFCDKLHLQAVVNLLVLHRHVVEVNQPESTI